MIDCRSVAISEEYADFITNAVYAPNIGNEGCYQRISGYYGVVYEPLASIDQLQLRNYPYNTIPALYGLNEQDISTRVGDTENALDEAGITRLQNIPTLRLRGQGCLVAIIDTGINIEDDDFRFSNGATRVLRLWDMTDQSAAPPQGINYGTEYTREMLDDLLDSSDDVGDVNDIREEGRYPGHDDIGHGNVLAKVVAGINGAVPESYIVAVKLKEAKGYLRKYHGVRYGVPAYQENDIMLAVNYVKNVADKLDMPVSLCLALGTNSRSHDGNSALSYILDSFVSTGMAMVSIAGGEQGNKQLHVSDKENVEMRLDSRQKELNVNIWGRNGSVASVGLVSPTGEVIDNVPARVNAIEERKLLIEGTTVTIEYDMSEGDTGEQFILVRLRDATEGVWRLNIQGDKQFDGYLPISQFIYENTYFLEPNPDTTLTDPSFARKTMTAVGYDVKSGALYIGQGRGFSRIGGIKPDIAAPMSVAVLTGAVTQLQQWSMVTGIRLDNIDVKSYLLRGAVQSDGEQYPNKRWGNGKLNVYNALEVLRTG